MGVEHTGHALPGQPGDGIQHHQLIFEIQVGFRLVQDQHLGLGGQSPGNEHHLQLAAADGSAFFVCQLLNAQHGHGLPCLFQIRLLGGGKGI